MEEVHREIEARKLIAAVDEDHYYDTDGFLRPPTAAELRIEKARTPDMPKIALEDATAESLAHYAAKVDEHFFGPDPLIKVEFPEAKHTSRTHHPERSPSMGTERSKPTMSVKTEKENWVIIDAVIATSKRVLLHGLPGTGKTYAAARANLNDDNQKVYQITMTEETPAAEIRGHFLPKGEEMVWMDGPAVLAWKEGARLVINEIDRASADSLSLLYAILDDPEFAEFTLPTGEIVRPKKGFHTVATMNGEPQDLPLPLQDRFPVTIEVISLNPEAILALPEDLQKVAKDSAFVKDDNRRLSIRMWMEYATLRVKLAKSHGKATGPKLAAKAVFGNRWQEAIRAIELNNVEETGD